MNGRVWDGRWVGGLCDVEVVAVGFDVCDLDDVCC